MRSTKRNSKNYFRSIVIFSPQNHQKLTRLNFRLNIDTGDSPPILQKSCILPLKHAKWVQLELEILEKAGVITRRVSPWACPIVLVPKCTSPGKTPRRMLCVEYTAVNKLLHHIMKVHSKVEGIFTLVPLLNIEEIYARLKDSHIYLKFDLRKQRLNP